MPLDVNKPDQEITIRKNFLSSFNPFDSEKFENELNNTLILTELDVEEITKALQKQYQDFTITSRGTALLIGLTRLLLLNKNDEKWKGPISALPLKEK